MMSILSFFFRINRPTFLAIAISALLMHQTNAEASFTCPTKKWSAGLFEHGVLFFDEVKGIDFDLAMELQRRSGCKILTAAIPRARIWHDIERGALDISFSGIETTERSDFAWFIPYMKLKNMVIFSKGVPKHITTPEQFKQRKDFIFGAVRSYKHGHFHDRFLQQLDFERRVSYYPDIYTLFEALKKERVQAIFSQSVVYNFMLSKTQFNYIPTILDWAPNEAGISHCLVLSKKSFDKNGFLYWNAVINDMKNDGFLINLFRKYTPPEEVQNMLIY